ncbi:MAG: alpha/beta hydrolase [Actinomycetota bacterium]|nr:alpha/beta hydrolase [Actinomycetota bacterium]
MFTGLAEQLADRYTVVTYDRRGNSRSPLRVPEPLSIEVQADDAFRLLTHVGGDEPAFVFGNSSGAIFGLELARRHPARVRALVAHEPPIFELLAEREHWRTVMLDVEATFAAEGTGPAMQVFNAGFGGGEATGEGLGEDGASAQQPPSEPDQARAAHLAEVGKAMEKNMEVFIGYEVPPVGRYTPDVELLGASSPRIVAAVGEASEGTPMYRATLALAERLGTKPAVFPGDHGGFGVAPEAFAAKLHEVLANP